MHAVQCMLMQCDVAMALGHVIPRCGSAGECLPRCYLAPARPGLSQVSAAAATSQVPALGAIGAGELGSRSRGAASGEREQESRSRGAGVGMQGHGEQGSTGQSRE